MELKGLDPQARMIYDALNKSRVGRLSVDRARIVAVPVLDVQRIRELRRRAYG